MNWLAHAHVSSVVPLKFSGGALSDSRTQGKINVFVGGNLRVRLQVPIIKMLRPEYASVYGMPAGMNPSIPASLEGLHPFFPQAREPEAPLSKDDVTLFMLLVTYSDALDALPLETTRSFSDLRELNAVLGGEFILSISDAQLTWSQSHSACIILHL